MDAEEAHRYLIDWPDTQTQQTHNGVTDGHDKSGPYEEIEQGQP